MSDQLIKQQAKYKKKLDTAFKKQWQQVRSKIRRLKIKRLDKRILIEDAKYCNGDLMDVLCEDGQFKDVQDYFDTIAKYLEFEQECYDYKDVVLVYMPTKMKQVMELITYRHNQIDRMKELIERLGIL